MTVKSPNLRAALVRPVLAPVLRRPLPVPRHTGEPRPGSLWPVLAMTAVAIVAAFMADATEEAWPLAVLLATPLLALGLDRLSRAFSNPRPRQARRAHIIADRRPILMRSVIAVAAGRRSRIVARRPRPILITASRPGRTTRRKPRMIVRRRSA